MSEALSVKNRMREICTSGSVRGGGGNIPTYSAQCVRSDVELAGIVADDDGLEQQAVRWMLPHSAPSVAIRTGSG